MDSGGAAPGEALLEHSASELGSDHGLDYLARLHTRGELAAPRTCAQDVDDSAAICAYRLVHHVPVTVDGPLLRSAS